MNLKLYITNFKNNYIRNIVYPYNYALLSTNLIRNNLNIEQIEKLNDYSINYWIYSLSKYRKKRWINYFIDKKLDKKLKLENI